MKKTTTLCAIIIALAINARAEYTDDCITFSCATSFWLHTSSPGWDGTLWVSADKTNWREWDGNRCDSECSGDRHVIYVRGDSANTKITGKAESAWRILGNRDSIACSGNIETLRGAKGMAPSPTPMAERCYAYMFMDNRRITEAPTLCATNLASRCYEHMFEGCTALTNAPALPVMMLAESCYECMFMGCTALTDGPELPAMELAHSCYAYMFADCTSLTNPPALPAMILAEDCYFTMFGDCEALTDAPKLPATRMAHSCYESMFFSCSSLTNPPALPAMILAGSCYADMFLDCSSLKALPSLPAKNLMHHCYHEMFSECTSLEVNTAAPGQEWKISATTAAPEWGTDMFSKTAGIVQGQPETNTTYYVKSAPEPVHKTSLITPTTLPKE